MKPNHYDDLVQSYWDSLLRKEPVPHEEKILKLKRRRMAKSHTDGNNSDRTLDDRNDPVQDDAGDVRSNVHPD